MNDWIWDNFQSSMNCPFCRPEIAEIYKIRILFAHIIIISVGNREENAPWFGGFAID